MSWLKTTWDRLTKPKATDEDEARQEYSARAIMVLLAVSLLIFTVLAIIIWIGGAYPFPAMWVILATDMVAGTLFILVLRGAWRPVCYFAPILFFLLGAFGSYLAGPASMVGMLYILAIQLSAMLLGAEAPWLMLIASIIVHLTLSWVYQQQPLVDMLAPALTFCASLLGITLLQRFSVLQLETLLGHWRQTGKSLQNEIEARLQAEEDKSRVSEAYKFTLQHMDNNVFRLRRREDGAIVYMLNEGSIPQDLGLSTEVVYGKILKEVSGEDLAKSASPYFDRVFRGEIVSYEADINGVVFSTILSPIETDGKIMEVVGSSYDITRRKRMEEQLKFISTHDTLTGLFNRQFFESEMERFEHSHTSPMSVLMADVDWLKTINDQLGHTAGDELLRRTAQVLREVFRKQDLIARIGGDEFAVLLPGLNAEGAQIVLRRLKTNLAKYNLEHRDLPLELSVGISTGQVSTKVEEILKLADDRMVEEKSEKKKHAHQ